MKGRISGSRQSMRREKAFSYQEFPQDGHIWYVRWLGMMFKSPTQSTAPMVQVHLERLGIEPSQVSDPVQVRNYLQRQEQPQPQLMKAVKVSVATIPALHIGALFLNGERVGSLKLPIRTVRFDLRGEKPRIMGAGDLHYPHPERWDENLPYRLVNLGEFQLPALNSKCILLTRRTKTRRIEVVVPCTEVFRSFYARESKIAREMLANPWREAANRIVNMQLTRPVEDGEYQVVLRAGMSERFPEYVANLVLTTAGWEAANHVHGSISLGARSWHLKAPLPFDMQDFSLKGRMLVLREDETILKLLCTEILGTSYPLGDKLIHFIRETDGRTGRTWKKAESTPPFWRAHNTILEEHEPLPNTSEEDPTAESQSVFHPTEGSGWLDPVNKKKIEKTESLKFNNVPKQGNHRRLRRSSAGAPSWRRSNSAPGQFRSEPEYSKGLSKRFKMVMDLVEILRKLRKIDTWRFVQPSCRWIAAYQDGVPLWALPNELPNEKGKITYRPWAVMDDSSGRSRTLLVLEIWLQGTRVIWFDVEPKGKGHCALIVKLGNGQKNIEQIINFVRKLCVASRGSWHLHKGKTGVSVPGAERVVAWRHSSSAGGLNEDSALQTLRDLVNR